MKSEVQQKQEIIKFGEWSFEPAEGILTSNNQQTRLEPLVAKLLIYLFYNQNLLLSRDKLTEILWPDKVVSDHALNRCISILRQTLSTKQSDAIIRTVPRRGYIAKFPKVVVPQNQKTETIQVKNSISHFARLGVPILLSLSVVIYFVFYNLTQNENNKSLSNNDNPLIAVLPFSVDTYDEQSLMNAKGVHEDLLTQLSKLQHLRVISGITRDYYDTFVAQNKNIGRELGADFVLKGSIQVKRLNDQEQTLRTFVELIDVNSSEQVWANTYTKSWTFKNLFDVYSEIAKGISKQLNAQLSTSEIDDISIMPTQNMEAYRLYIETIQSFYTRQISANSPEYQRALERVVMMDPGFTRAWAELTSVYALQSFSTDNPESIKKAKASIKKIEDIAPDSIDYLYAQAAYVYYVVKDYATALSLISKVVEKNPSDVRSLTMKSYIERRLGDFEGFLSTYDQLRKLEPRNPIWTYLYFNRLALLNRYDELESSLLYDNYVHSEEINKFQNLIDYRHHQDSKVFLNDTLETCEYSKNNGCSWLALVLNELFDQAYENLKGQPISLERHFERLNMERMLFTIWFMQKNNKIIEHIDEVNNWLNQFEEHLAYHEQYEPSTLIIYRALLDGVKGDKLRSKEKVEKFFKRFPIDWAERINARAPLCRVLGMLDDNESAISCIKEGLREGSAMHPFLEYNLPFYDSMRNSKVFLAEQKNAVN